MYTRVENVLGASTQNGPAIHARSCICSRDLGRTQAASATPTPLVPRTPLQSIY